MSKVTIQLTVTAGRRHYGYDKDAVIDYKLEHPELDGALILRCRRGDLDEKLKLLGEVKPELEFNAPIEDIMSEIVIENTGVPLTESEKRLFSQDGPVRRTRRTTIKG